MPINTVRFEKPPAAPRTSPLRFGRPARDATGAGGEVGEVHAPQGNRGERAVCKKTVSSLGVKISNFRFLVRVCLIWS